MENIDVSSSNEDDKDDIMNYKGKKSLSNSLAAIKGFDRTKEN
jgi:hypothetical protein